MTLGQVTGWSLVGRCLDNWAELTPQNCPPPHAIIRHFILLELYRTEGYGHLAFLNITYNNLKQQITDVVVVLICKEISEFHSTKTFD